jgi:hypothetical protein
VSKVPVVYVAGKFRGAKLADVDRNISFASMFVAPIAEAGAMPVTVHLCEGVRAHDIHQENNGQWWVDATLEVLRRCDALVVIPGWQTSSGTIGEIKEAFRLGLPVFEAEWAEDVSFNSLPVPTHPINWCPIAALHEELPTPYLRVAIDGPDFAEWVQEVSR